MRYDILLTGGTVIDPLGGLNDQFDVAIVDGQIVDVAKNMDPQKATRTIAVPEKYVVPGLVDIHAQVYVGVTTWGIAAGTLATSTQA